MWDFVLDLIYSSVVSAFNWFSSVLNAAPGAWDTIFTIFVILALSRFLLGPLLGVSFSGQSDKASTKTKTKISGSHRGVSASQLYKDER